jgi:hypothetical protein
MNLCFENDPQPLKEMMLTQGIYERGLVKGYLEAADIVQRNHFLRAMKMALEGGFGTERQVAVW